MADEIQLLKRQVAKLRSQVTEAKAQQVKLKMDLAIANLLVSGLTREAVAEQLGVSTSRVDVAVREIEKRWGV